MEDRFESELEHSSESIEPIYRRATGEAVERLYGRLALFDGREGVVLPKTDHGLEPRVELVQRVELYDNREVLGQVDTSSDEFKAQLASRVESLTQPQRLTADSFATYDDRRGDNLLVVHFDAAGRSQLEQERLAVWRALAEMTSTQLRKRQAYTPDFKLMVAKSILRSDVVDLLHRGIRQRLPLEVTLEPLVEPGGPQ